MRIIPHFRAAMVYTLGNGSVATAPTCGAAPEGGVANIQNASPVTSIAANSCDVAATTAVMTGLTATMTLSYTPTTDISGVSGWGQGVLYFIAWPTAGQLNYKRCNSSSGPVTPGAVTWNWSAK